MAGDRCDDDDHCSKHSVIDFDVVLEFFRTARSDYFLLCLQRVFLEFLFLWKTEQSGFCFFAYSHPCVEHKVLFLLCIAVAFPSQKSPQSVSCRIAHAADTFDDSLPVAGKELELNMDYYYTDFDNQMVLNPYTFNNENKYSIENLSGKSYSHTAQIDATYPFFEGFTATGAYRYTEAKTTYDGMLLTRPLTSRYKGLLTLGYKTPLELWHFDVTGSVNGPGHLYDRSLYHAYFQLQAQITREFRYFSVYVGGENLTNYTISDPIRSAADPWSAMFDATQVWGPTEGAMFYIGMRFKLEKM